MKITKQLTDDAILSEIGKRILARRFELNMTQAELAKNSGVSKRTVERIEDGMSSQFVSIIRIFRVLNLMENFDLIISEPRPRPMELLKQEKNRSPSRRVRKKKSKEKKPSQWRWEEDK